MTQGMQPLKSEMRVGRKKSKRQVNVVSKLDNLYKLIRRLGLHYKISENFGSTTIIIGRNYHGFDELYNHSSSDDSTESKHVPERDDSLTRQEAAKFTLENMDTLYRFVRGLGLHYRLTENYGSTSITIGRNHHPFSELYEDPSTHESMAVPDLGRFDTKDFQKIKIEADAEATEMEAHSPYGDVKETSEKGKLEELLSAYEVQETKTRMDFIKLNAEMEALKLANSKLKQQDENSRVEIYHLVASLQSQTAAYYVLQQQEVKSQEEINQLGCEIQNLVIINDLRKPRVVTESAYNLPEQQKENSQEISQLKADNESLSTRNSFLVEQEMSLLQQEQKSQEELSKLSDQNHNLNALNKLLQQQVDKTREVSEKKSLLMEEENKKLREDLLSSRRACSELTERNKCVEQKLGSREDSYFLRKEVTRFKEERFERDVDNRETYNACLMAERTQEIYRGMLEEALTGSNTSWKEAARDMLKREEKRASLSQKEELNQSSDTSGTEQTRKDWLAFFHCRQAGEPFGLCENCNQTNCFWDEDLLWNGRGWFARDEKREPAPEGTASDIYEYWMSRYHCRQDSKSEDHCDVCAVEFGWYWQNGLYWNGDDWAKKEGFVAESDDETDDQLQESDDSMVSMNDDNFFDEKFHQGGWYDTF